MLDLVGAAAPALEAALEGALVVAMAVVVDVGVGPELVPDVENAATVQYHFLEFWGATAQSILRSEGNGLAQIGSGAVSKNTCGDCGCRILA